MAKVRQEEISARLESLRSVMRKKHVGAVFITDKSNVYYYSGFTGDDSALLITNSRQNIFTDSRYVEEAEKSALGFEVVVWKKSIPYQVGEICRKLHVKHVGYEENTLSVRWYNLLNNSAKKAELVAFDSEIRNLRVCKSDFEIKAMRKALKVGETAFKELRGFIRAGMTETDVALELEWQMRKLGASGVAFPTIVAEGANASLPHAHPGKRKIKKGSLLLIDWGACVEFYNSDLTRTLFIDSICQNWQSLYNCVLDAQVKAIAEISPEVSGGHVDKIARNCLKKEKLAQYFGHGLGHGVGVDVHEGPRLSKANKTKLPVGSVVTVEPGVYFPGKAGIRIEDMVLVTSGGGRVLSSLPKSLEWAVI